MIGDLAKKSFCHHERGIGWAGQGKPWILGQSDASREQHHVFLEDGLDSGYLSQDLLLLKTRKALSDASDEQHHIQMSKSPSSKLAQIGLHHLHRKAVPQFLQAFDNQ